MRALTILPMRTANLRERADHVTSCSLVLCGSRTLHFCWFSLHQKIDIMIAVSGKLRISASFSMLRYIGALAMYSNSTLEPTRE